MSGVLFLGGIVLFSKIRNSGFNWFYNIIHTLESPDLISNKKETKDGVITWMEVIYLCE